MTIITHQHYSDQWTAYDDNTYDGPGSAFGSGHTEAEAVGDLLEKLEDRGLYAWKLNTAFGLITQ
jgi:hypothetical protein